MAKRWTPEEETAWRLFFRGKAKMPEGRELHCAIERLAPKPIADLADPAIAHATSAAAMRLLSRVPHRHDGDHIRFVEHVQTVAVAPWLDGSVKHPWPPAVFLEAVQAARASVMEPAHG